MAQIQHSAIPDAQLHEPKGVVSANASTVYIADGAGSGNWRYPAGGAYGENYIAGGATSQTLSAASAYARLDPGTAWDPNGFHNTTLNADDGTITLTVAGTYLVNFYAHFITAALASGTKYNFKYAVNGSTSTRLISAQKFTNGADSLSVSATGIVTFAANDVLSIHVAGDGTSSNTAITVLEAGLSVVLLKV